MLKKELEQKYKEKCNELVVAKTELDWSKNREENLKKQIGVLTQTIENVKTYFMQVSAYRLATTRELPVYLEVDIFERNVNYGSVLYVKDEMVIKWKQERDEKNMGNRKPKEVE